MHEVRFVHFFDGVFFFAEGGGESTQPDWSTGVFIEQGDHEIAVDFVETLLIDAEHVQGFAGNFAGDAATGADFGEIAGAAEESVGNSWCATAASGDFFGAGIVHLNVQNFGGAEEDNEQVRRFVEIETVDDAEARTKGRGDESCASRGANEREMIQVEGMNARAGALSDDQIDAKIFHGGIEDFFDGRLETMDFVEKENFLGFEGSEDGSEVAFAFEERTSAGLDGDLQFVGDNLGEGSFAKAWRAVEKDVIEGFVAIAGGFESDGDVFFDALLADVFVEGFRTNAGVEARVIIRGHAGDNARRVIVGWFFGIEIRHFTCRHTLFCFHEPPASAGGRYTSFSPITCFVGR